MVAATAGRRRCLVTLTVDAEQDGWSAESCYAPQDPRAAAAAAAATWLQTPATIDTVPCPKGEEVEMKKRVFCFAAAPVAIDGGAAFDPADGDADDTVDSGDVVGRAALAHQLAAIPFALRARAVRVPDSLDGGSNRPVGGAGQRGCGGCSLGARQGPAPVARALRAGEWWKASGNRSFQAGDLRAAARAYRTAASALRRGIEAGECGGATSVGGAAGMAGAASSGRETSTAGPSETAEGASEKGRAPSEGDESASDEADARARRAAAVEAQLRYMRGKGLMAVDGRACSSHLDPEAADAPPAIVIGRAQSAKPAPAATAETRPSRRAVRGRTIASRSPQSKTTSRSAT